MKATALVFLGAGIGGVARFWLGQWITKSMAAGFPWGTFNINLTGSLLIGLFFGLQPPSPTPTDSRLLLVFGFLGGYTTFSTFSFETLHMIQQQDVRGAVLYALGSVVLGLTLAYLGFVAGQAIRS